MKYTNILWATMLAYALTACGGEKPKEEEKEKPEKEVKSEENKQPETPKTAELSEEAKKIAKKWAMKEFTHTDGKREEEKGKRILNLKTDGSFEKIFGENVVETGTWNVKDKMLITKSSKGTDEKATIKEVSNQKLITTSDDGKMTETYQVVE